MTRHVRRAAPIVDQGIFESFKRDPGFREMRQQLEDARYWTGMLVRWATDIRAQGELEPVICTGEFESHPALRRMAREPLEARAMLGAAVREFLTSRQIRARVIRPWRDVAYVLLAGSSVQRELRRKELLGRCFIVGAKLREVPEIVGIAMDRSPSHVGYAEDILCMRKPWSSADAELADSMIEDLGWFRGQTWSTFDQEPTAAYQPR